MGNAISNGNAPGWTAAKSYTLDPEWMAVSFSDDGMGIPPENMDKLFEPLFTTKTKGIGLGMERVVGGGFEPPFPDPKSDVLPIRRSHIETLGALLRFSGASCGRRIRTSIS